MKYYRIKGSIDTKILGRYPQNEEMMVYGNIQERGADGPIIGNFVLPEPILHPKALTTSYMSIVAISELRFCVINKELLDFISQYKMGHFQAWKMKIHHSSEILNNYLLFHLSRPVQDRCLDIQESEFLEVTKGATWQDRDYKPIEFNDYADYIKAYDMYRFDRPNMGISAEKLVLDMSGVDDDLFRLTNLPGFGSGYYVSDRLKSDIEKNGFTGMTFAPMEEVNRRIEVRGKSAS